MLAYHKVSYDPHPFFKPVPPDVFEQQMQFLSRCYRVMPLEELMERNRMGDVPPRAVAITFDDGYRDNYEFAFPVLRRYRLPATIFVTTGAIDNCDVLWHDRIFDSFRFATVERAQLRGAHLPELILQPLEERRRSLLPVLARAKTLGGEERLQFVEEIEHALKPALDPGRSQRMLTWRQLHLHAKPIGLLNTRGFFDPLLAWLDRMVEEGFLKHSNRDLLRVSDDVEKLLDLLASVEA